MKRNVLVLTGTGSNAMFVRYELDITEEQFEDSSYLNIAVGLAIKDGYSKPMTPLDDRSLAWRQIFGCNDADIWTIADVKALRPGLDDEYCMDVLDTVLADNKAKRGITEQMLIDAAEDLYPK
jgi:hypothetical protein